MTLKRNQTIGNEPLPKIIALDIIYNYVASTRRINETGFRFKLSGQKVGL